jgi:ketosteroid isomerase-like protein
LGPEELDVIQAEEAWVEAELNNDEAMLRNVIDDRFVFNSNNGTTSGKEELIESARAWNMTGQHITERTVLVDGDMALIFGTTELRFAAPDGEETVSLLRYTSTYVKRGTQWRAIALHMARRTTDE